MAAAPVPCLPGFEGWLMARVGIINTVCTLSYTLMGRSGERTRYAFVRTPTREQRRRFIRASRIVATLTCPYEVSNG